MVTNFEMLPGREDTVGVTAKDNRLFVDAVLYRYRSGILWSDLPARFGEWRNVHRRHRRCCETGVWERIFLHSSQDADNEYQMIDATIVRVHQHGTGSLKKRVNRRLASREAVERIKSTP